MNAVDPEHPSADQLAAFGLGKLSPPDQAAIETHVSRCETCCARLRDLPADDLATLVREVLVASTALPDLPETRSDALAGPPSPGWPEVPAELAAHPRYYIEEVLGAGGMGTVFKARHRLMQRSVALKVVSPALLHRPDAVERFQREVRAAAQLSHPNIVTAFDAEEAGRVHFLVMEFIEGTSLARLVAKQGPLPVALACDYARQAALGLQHAHERGMVHRDIKPHNLMLTPQGQVKILDFGLARFLSESAPMAGAPALDTAVPARSGEATLDGTVPGPPADTGPDGVAGAGTASQTPAGPGADPLTRQGAVMGSLNYIAPEQLNDAHAADIRADIYSLGCTLYHLLAGRAPFPGTVTEKLRAHERERPRPLAEVRKDVPAGLAAVLGRLLAKGPAQRYQTPAEVAEALAPFAAAPRARLWRRVAVAAAVALLAAAVALSQLEPGTALVRIATNRGELVIETEDPDVAVEVLRGGERVRLLDLKIGNKIDLSAGDYEVKLSAGKEGLRLSTDRFTLSRGGKQILTVTHEPAVREEIGQVRVLRGHPGTVTAVARSPNGRLALSGGEDGTIRLWDIRSGKELRQFIGHQGPAVGVQFRPEGRQAMSAGQDKTVRLWDVQTGQELRKFELPAKSDRLLVASADGRRALSCGEDFRLRLWDIEARKEIGCLSGHTAAITTADFSPDGRRLLSGSMDHTLRLWDAETGKELRRLPGHLQGVGFVAFSRDGRRALSVGQGETAIRLWDLETGQLVRHLDQFPAAVTSAEFSPDGRYVLSGEGPWFQAPGRWDLMADTGIRLWDLETGKQVRFGGIALPICRAVFMPDGRYALSAGMDKLLRLWRLPAAGEAPERWQLPQTEEVRRFWGHPAGEGVWGVAFSPDGGRAISCGADGYVRQWDVASGKELWACDCQANGQFLRDVAVSPDGRIALAAVYDHTVRVLDMATGKELRRFKGHRAKVHGVSFSSDGRLALSASGTSCADREQDNTVRLWEVATGKEMRRFEGHTGWVRTAVFSPDDRYVLSASLDRTVRLWDARTGREVRRFTGHEEGALSAVFSPDGRQALSTSWDRTIRLWEVATGKELRRFERQADTVESVVFSADGCRALSAGKDGTVRLWDVATGKELLEMKGHTGMVHAAVLSRDGRYALSGGVDGTVRLWRLPVPAKPAK